MHTVKQTPEPISITIENLSKKEIKNVKLFDYNFQTQNNIKYSSLYESNEMYQNILNYVVSNQLTKFYIILIRVRSNNPMSYDRINNLLNFEHRTPFGKTLEKKINHNENDYIESFTKSIFDFKTKGIDILNNSWFTKIGTGTNFIISELLPKEKLDIFLFLS